MKHPINLAPLCALVMLFVLHCCPAIAQDQRPRPAADSISQKIPDSLKKISRDSVRRRGFSGSLFADSDKATTGDYMLRLEEVYQVLNTVENEGVLNLEVQMLNQKLSETDTTLRLVNQNLSQYSNALNLRNLQMFRVLLQNISEDLDHSRDHIDEANKKLQGLKKQMLDLRKDTLLRQLLRDSVMRNQFQTQLRELRTEWRSADSLLRGSLSTINQYKTHASAGLIMATQLTDRVNDLLNRSGTLAFGKEYPYLWQTGSDTAASRLKQELKKAYQGEKRALNYYFSNAGEKRLVMLLAGALFFWWISRNLRRLKRANKLETLPLYDVTWIPKQRIAAAFTVMLCLAPLFDLLAPSVYIESMQFLLLIALSFIVRKQWPRKLFYYWLGVVALFILISFSSHVIAPTFWQRSWLLFLAAISGFAGWQFRKQLPQGMQWRKFIRFVLTVSIVLNGLSIICNIFGRFSLAQIFALTAIFAITEAVALAVFIRLWLEAILLQVQSSRIKHGVDQPFDPARIVNGFRPPIQMVGVLLWLIVFTTNLSIYTWLFNNLVAFLTSPRKMGSINFTFWSVVLFFLIIWAAHLLQRSIGYFMGETGDDEEPETASPRSRLVVMRLLLLVGGYLLAIAASGLPIDKITIVLGALGVGIGMGLQNIVNNFVSGMILVFDRRLRVGDSIEVGDKSGKVKEISLRSSTLFTPDGAEVIIPNGDLLSQQIVNWTLSNNTRRVALPLSVHTKESRESVTTMIREVLKQSTFVVEKREPQVLIEAITDEGYDLKVLFWCTDQHKSEQALSEIRYLLHQKLGEKGISVN